MEIKDCTSEQQRKAEGEQIMVENGRQQEIQVENHMLDAFEDDSYIKIGRTFGCEEEAYNVYNTYAISKGFGVRKGKKFWRKNELSGCEFVCSREGESKVVGPQEERQRERLEYRKNCKARIKYKIVNGIWKVVDFEDTHTHGMVKENLRHLISSARNLTPSSKHIINSLVDAGVGPTKAFRYLAKQAGGFENVGFIEQDVHNHQQLRRRNMISGGDAQSLINHLANKQMKDPNFFYTFQLDDDGRLCNVFWRDSFSRMQYECFGDVMLFDTTYRTNKWNMVFAPFVGLNNHWNNIYFGCAFLHDETSLSFEWLFKSFLHSMGGKEPKTIFTDQDPAMGGAIKNVLPNARHRLCEWHIEKNAMQRIPHLMSQPGFKAKYFKKLLWRCKTIEDFELTWQQMNAEYNVEDNSWLKRLYSLREKWCPAFNQDSFSGDIRSTQRSESANRVFTDLTCKATTLVEFANQYDSKASDISQLERKNDYTFYGKPKLQVRDCGILEHAAKVYTRTIFFKFQDEFLQCLADWNVEKTSQGSYDIYTLQKDESEEIYIVQFDGKECNIVCSCHLFETAGWLCRHALRIMHINLRFKTIPESYILKRWTKIAKQGVVSDDDNLKEAATSQESVTIRLNRLLRDSFSVMSLAVGDDATEKIAQKYLNAARKEIICYQNRSFSNQGGPVVNASNEQNTLRLKVQDPVNKKRKGDKNTRMKSFSEKKRVKRTKTQPSDVSNSLLVDEPIGSNLDFEFNENVQLEALAAAENLSFTQLLTQDSLYNLVGHSQI